ncbi:MAG: hypothetical protein HUU22_09825 [Phycisphaerae bacterium]|nr:hypothetical protein [Phycisphaerae bacterium]NUQ46319.1 hypothetical protein [Phycisphaerae bacterium]
MLTADLLLFVVILPLAAPALTAVLLTFASQRVAKNVLPRVLPLLFAGGCVVAHVGRHGWPGQFPPLEAWQWFPYIVAAAAATGLWEANARGFSWSRGATRLFLAVAIPVALLARPYVIDVWSRNESAIHLSVLVLAMFIVLALWEYRRRDDASFADRGPAAVAAMATSGVLGLTGSVVLAELAAAIAFSLIGLVLVSRLVCALPCPRAAVRTVACGLTGLAICGHYYSETTIPPLMLLGAAPVAAVFAETRRVHESRAAIRALIRHGPTVLLCGAAVALAYAGAETPGAYVP